MVGWHHRLHRHEYEQAPGDGEGQGGPVCCRPRGHKQSDMIERPNNNRRKTPTLFKGTQQNLPNNVKSLISSIRAEKCDP